MPIVNANTKTRLFRDISMTFLPHPATGDVVVKNDVDAVKQSIRNLIMTMVYDHPFNPNNSCQIFGMLFDSMDPMTLNVARQTVVNTLAQHEPRCSLLDVSLEASDDGHGIYVSVLFTILNETSTQEVTVFINRSR